MNDKPGSSHKFTNRLANETSPYLLQHAHNPVDWHPWGPEAIEKARRENKPIFLSAGYSTCYWCHVMERECFENEAIAAEMNRLFINIKVDREERPDVDQLYMTAVQLLTRHGGWPMSVWLKPDLQAFYGGTYFPPANFVSYLRALEDAYRNRRDDVDKSAAQITAVLRQLAQPAAPQSPLQIDIPAIDTLIDRSTADYDPQFGGFGGAPKFPRETLLELLLEYLNSPATGPKAEKIRSQLDHTLIAMADGGIRDQLGGGFHRYSTDAQWLVPHFEIMLYDNAMLGWIYAEAYRQTKAERHAETTREVLDFVLREMTSPSGAFFTAFDAEVDAQEGLSYLWTLPEIESILEPDDAKLFARVYGLDRGPNFADPHHGTGTPDKNILHLPQPLEAIAREMGISRLQLRARLEPMQQNLYRVRSQRKQPLLDTKILTSWNALMIRALAHAGRVFNEKKYVDAAARAAEFLLREQMNNGLLYHSSRDGRAGQSAFLDDYAFLAQALMALHSATNETHWKQQAEALVGSMAQRFGDEGVGGFFFTSADATDLIVRQKMAQDSPLPSGNAVAAMALLTLGKTKDCAILLAAFSGQMTDHCESMSSMVQAALHYLRQAEPIDIPASSEAGQIRPKSPQEIAAGVVSTSAQWFDSRELRIALDIQDGFHINAHEPAGDDTSLIPTRLSVDVADASIEYPPPAEQRFEFSRQSLQVYSGQITLRVRFPKPIDPDARVRLTLSYQACNENSCLPPAGKHLVVKGRTDGPIGD